MCVAIPVGQRIELKRTVLVYKTLNGLSSQYLADNSQLTIPLPADDDFHRVMFQELARSVTVAGLLLWNIYVIRNLRLGVPTIAEDAPVLYMGH